MNEDLLTLLTDVAPQKEIKGTYRVYSTIDSSYYPIDRKKLGKFWQEYCDGVAAENEQDPDDFEESKNYHIGEKVTDFCPLICDFNFPFHFRETESTEDWEPYDDKFIWSLCSICQDTLEELFINAENELEHEFTVMVLESVDPFIERKKGMIIYHTQIRLQFPFSRLNIDWINYIFRPRVVQILRAENIIGSLHRAPAAEWEKIISIYNDENNIIPFYGSSNHVEKKPLKLTFIFYRILSSDIEDEILPKEIPLTEDSFPLCNHKHVTSAFINNDFFANKKIKHWLPFILSIDYWPVTLSLKESEEKYAGSIPTPVKEEKKISGKADTNFEICNKLLRFVDKKRYTYYPSWIKIGKALYEATEGGNEGLNTWIKNSEKATESQRDSSNQSQRDSYPEFYKSKGDLSSTAFALYHTFYESKINWITLAEYAKKDNPKSYKEWHNNWTKEGIKKAVSCDHSDVMEAIYRFYFMDFVYSSNSINGFRWFSFVSHRWVPNANGTRLRKKISKDFVSILEAYRLDILQESHKNRNEREKEKKEKEASDIFALIKKCKNVAYKNALLKEAEECFECDYFSEASNSNPYVTGVTNGVMEVVNNQIYFRDGERQDFITINTNVQFNSDFNESHPLVVEVINWLEKVFPDKSLLNHFLKFSASLFISGNNDKIFAIWTGSGNNSKSMLIKLFEAVWGKYCIKFPMSLVTESGGKSSNATPELARAKDTRIAFLDESDDEVSLKKDIIKRLTGGDSFFARLLHDNGSDVKSTFKLVLGCNNPPGITNGDKATKERLSYFPFLAEWRSDAPLSEEEQYRLHIFKKDPNFDKRIPTLAPAFLWICVQYFPIYMEEGIVNPEIVKKHTEEYWKSNDIFSQFVSDNVQNDAGNINASVKLSDLYLRFKTWYQTSFPGNKVPTRIKANSEFTSRWGPSKNNAWFGIRLTGDDDDNFANDMKNDFMKSGKKEI